MAKRKKYKIRTELTGFSSVKQGNANYRYSPYTKKSKIRILSSSSSGLTIIGSGNDTEIEILGNHKYKNKKTKGTEISVAIGAVLISDL